MPELNIRVKDMGDITLVTLEGFLDAHTFEQLDEAIQGLLEDGKSRLVADLHGVEYISSAGAGVFIGSLTEAKTHGGSIILLNPTESVQEVFDLLGLSTIFTIVKTLDEAKKQF